MVLFVYSDFSSSGSFFDLIFFLGLDFFSFFALTIPFILYVLYFGSVLILSFIPLGRDPLSILLSVQQSLAPPLQPAPSTVSNGRCGTISAHAQRASTAPFTGQAPILTFIGSSSGPRHLDGAEGRSCIKPMQDAAGPHPNLPSPGIALCLVESPRRPLQFARPSCPLTAPARSPYVLDCI